MTVTENRRDYLESLYQDMSIKELRTLAAERTPDVKSRSKQAYAEALLAWHIAQEEQAPQVETAEPVKEATAGQEIISTPKTPKPFIIREETHPLQAGKSIFRVYCEDGTPLYIGRETVEEAEKALRASELVSSVEIIYQEEATTKHITVYQLKDKTYCAECKPKNGKRGTLVLSGYGICCDGCGQDLKEMAEEQAQKPAVGTLIRLKGSLSKHIWRITRYYSDNYHFVCEMVNEPENTDRERVWNVDDVEVLPEPPQPQKPSAIMLTGLFDAPCSRCHLPTKGRCQECNVPLSPLCANIGRSERMVCLACHVQFIREEQARDIFASFAQAVAMYCSDKIDPFSVDIEGSWDWQKAWGMYRAWEAEHSEVVAIV